LNAITATTGATVDGRLLARNAAVTLDTNTITRARCDTTGPSVTITGVPKETARNFTIRVTVSDSIGIARTVVYLDGKRIRRSSSDSFTTRIKARRLKPGRHRIRVVSRDAAGNKTVKRTSFLRSRGASQFTGINFTG
jgi:hypothetical protein